MKDYFLNTRTRTVTTTNPFDGDVIDSRLIEAGWAGYLEPEELAFLKVKLAKDPALTYLWGFRPSTKRRPEWAIRQVALAGDPDRRATNIALARTRLTGTAEL